MSVSTRRRSGERAERPFQSGARPPRGLGDEPCHSRPGGGRGRGGRGAAGAAHGGLGHFAYPAAALRRPSGSRRPSASRYVSPRQPGVERAEPPARSRSSGGASFPRAARTRSVRAAARAGPARARRAACLGHRQQLTAASAPRPRTWPARRQRTCCAPRGSGVSSAARSRNAAAAATPPRACASGRALELAGDRLVGPARHGRDAMLGGRDRTRIGRPGERTVPSRRSCGGRRPVDRRADQRMAERPGTKRDQPGCLGRRAARGVDAEPPAARHSSAASPTGSAAASSSSRWVSRGSGCEPP